MLHRLWTKPGHSCLVTECTALLACHLHHVAFLQWSPAIAQQSHSINMPWCDAEPNAGAACVTAARSLDAGTRAAVERARVRRSTLWRPLSARIAPDAAAAPAAASGADAV
jgi:hypothetical protein